MPREPWEPEEPKEPDGPMGQAFEEKRVFDSREATVLQTNEALHHSRGFFFISVNETSGHIDFIASKGQLNRLEMLGLIDSANEFLAVVRQKTLRPGE